MDSKAVRPIFSQDTAEDAPGGNVRGGNTEPREGVEEEAMDPPEPSEYNRPRKPRIGRVPRTPQRPILRSIFRFT